MEIPAKGIQRGSGRQLWLFLIILFLLSWPFWVISGVLPRGGMGAYDFRWLFAQIGVFGPSLAALIASGTGRSELRQNSMRMLPILLAPLVVPGVLIALASPSSVSEFTLLPSIATVIVATLIILFFSPANRRLLNPGTGEAQGRPDAKWVVLSITLLPGLLLIAWLLVNVQGGRWGSSALRGGVLESAWIILVCFAHNLLLGGSLGEEIGWRGFLLPELLRRMNPIAASITLGVVWGLWHLPIDLYAGFVAEGPMAVMVRIIYVLPLTILFTWFYLRAKGSLLVAMLLHTSLNVMGDLGLSRFENSAIVFFVLMAAAALIVSVSSPVFRMRPEQEMKGGNQ
jgi:membrane protease YdiL (CAAX protease family)